MDFEKGHFQRVADEITENTEENNVFVQSESFIKLQLDQGLRITHLRKKPSISFVDNQ